MTGSTNRQDKYVKISEIKSSTPIDVLCKGFPGILFLFLIFLDEFD